MKVSQRNFTGSIWRGDNKTLFTSWGVGYIHKKHEELLGFAFILENLLDNTELVLKIFEFNENKAVIDPGEVNPIFQKSYNISNLSIVADWQEIFFPVEDLELHADQLYFITIEGDAFLGCGESSCVLSKENYIFRGYFRQLNRCYKAVADNASIAWRVITRNSIIPKGNWELAPVNIDAVKKESRQCRAQSIELNEKVWRLPRKEMRFTGNFWPGDARTQFNGWAIGYIQDKDAQPAYIAFTLQNITANNILYLSIYPWEDNTPSIDLACISPIYQKSYMPDDLDIYSCEQEVFFPTPDLELAPDSPCLISILGNCVLGAGYSYDDFPRSNYFFRGYYKTRTSHILNNISGTQSVAWRPISK